MRVHALLIAMVCSAACGGASAPAPPEAAEPAVTFVSDEPPPPPPPRCPFDLASVRTSNVVLNYAIDDQPESWVRVSAAADGDEEHVSFEYERRDERGREVGVESYVCSARGLALESSGGPSGEVRFEPPVLVVPVGSGSGGGSGTMSLVQPTGTVEFTYLHDFEAFEEGTSEFGERHFRVENLLALSGEVEVELRTETLWVVDSGLIGAVARTQQVDGVETVERLRTVVPRGSR